MSWLKTNWFKLALVILVGAFVIAYIFYVREQARPKSFKGQLWQEIQNRQ